MVLYRLLPVLCLCAVYVVGYPSYSKRIPLSDRVPNPCFSPLAERYIRERKWRGVGHLCPKGAPQCYKLRKRSGFYRRIAPPFLNPFGKVRMPSICKANRVY